VDESKVISIIICVLAGLTMGLLFYTFFILCAEWKLIQSGAYCLNEALIVTYKVAVGLMAIDALIISMLLLILVKVVNGDM